MKRVELVALVRQLASCVQMDCGGDMTKLLSSGFPVQKPNRAPAQLPARPAAPKIAQGQTGSAIATSKKVAGAYVYNWQVALADAPETVVQRTQSTGARTTFYDLLVGKAHLFKVNAVGTAGTFDWSGVGSRIVI